MRTSRSVVVAAFAVVLLAGCGSYTEEPPASPTPTPTKDAEPSPSPEPSSEPTETAEPVDPHPALADLIISTAGLGPLTVGSTPPATNPGAAMIAWDAAFCSGEGWEGDGDPGRWVPSGYDNDTNYMGEPATPFYVDATDTGVHRIDVMGTGPHTVEGIRIGSTLAELQATYPALVGPLAGPVSQVWWLQDASGSIAASWRASSRTGRSAPRSCRSQAAAADSPIGRVPMNLPCTSLNAPTAARSTCPCHFSPRQLKPRAWHAATQA